MIKSLKKSAPIITIIAAAVLLRPVNLSELFYFTYDESVPAFVGRRLWMFGHIPLIGGVTPFGFHLGPYFYLFLAVLLKIKNFDPVIWGIAGALIAAFTTYMMYVLAAKISNRFTGLLASAFWAFSYLANMYDRRMWALYWGPVISLVVIFALIKIKEKKENFIFPLSMALAFGIHADPSNLVFVLFTAVSWIYLKLPLSKKALIGISIVILSFAPLILFDLRHNFANTKPVLDFIQAGRNTPGFEIQKAIDNTLLFPKTFSRLVVPKTDEEISKQYSYCPAYAKGKLESVPWYATLAFALLLLSFIYWSQNKKNHSHWTLITILVTVYFVGIHVYGTILKADIFEHYVTGVFAVFLLILARAVSMLPRKLAIVFLGLFISFNTHKVLSTQNGLGLSVKKQAVEYTMEQIGDRQFSLESLSTCWKLNGYRYLFAAYGKEPVKSYVDPNFAYLYGTTPVHSNHPQTVVAFIAHDFIPENEGFYQRYSLLKSHEVNSKTFKNLEVVIMDNSTGWFDQPTEFKGPIQNID